VLVTAHDIIFFWVARMMMAGLKFMGDVPFRDIFITPLIMAEGGGKMSKSKGNAIDPLVLVEEQGADAVRLTLASHGAQSRTVKLSMKRFEGYRNFTNKLWNATRFALMNVEDLSPEDYAAGVDGVHMELEDRWILSLLRRMTEDVDRALEAYQFEQYLGSLYDFTWKHFCDWYLELIKPRLYASQKEDYGEEARKSRLAAQVVLVTVLETLQRLLHPVAPFITEEIWQRIRLQWGGGAEGAANPACRSLRASSLMVADWPQATEIGERDEAAEARMELLQQVVYLVRNIRGEMNVPPGAPTDVEIVSSQPGRRAELETQAPHIRGLVNIGELRIVESPSDAGFASTAIHENITIRVPLPAELRDQERARLEKEAGRVEADIRRIAGKLGNEKFAANAPAEIVDAERQRLEQQEAKLAELKGKQASLA
jgi:valyl-tRNA synthetase